MNSDYTGLVAPARQRAARGDGSVLDAMLALAGDMAAPGLAQWLLAELDILALPMPGEAARVLVDALPGEVCRQSRCALVALADGSERLAMADPWDDATAARVATLLKRTPRLAALSAERLEAALAALPAGVAGSAPARPGHGQPAAARPVEAFARSEGQGGAVVDFVGETVAAAVAAGASDIHFECDRDGLVVKLRRDGVLRVHARWDSPVKAAQVISRIKVLAQLDITETRVPQDGRLRFGAPREEFDLRVSIMPSVHGEDAVLRVLDRAHLRQSASGVSLDSLGFAPTQAQVLRDLAGMPHGMLLMTGPTGSGKTTTVYAALSEINNGEEKIVTIEDPVEYELPGVLQIPVNERKGLTFARGLRSILRHDPDRILVGEIRDSETAEIAVQSALTGHLVFTTVHANSVFDVTGRFRHFGIDMFAFMSALNGVVVQRLLRCLCPECKSSRPASEQESAWLARHRGPGRATTELPRAVGCDACGGMGYRGRTVLAEVHVIDDEFRDLVVSQASIAALRSHIARQGERPLMAQAADMVCQGLTTAEEVRRVVGWL